MKDDSRSPFSLNQLKWLVLALGGLYLFLWGATCYFWLGYSWWQTLLSFIFGLLMTVGLVSFAFRYGMRLRDQLVAEIKRREMAEYTLKLHSSALEAAAHAVVITDAAGIITWVNPAFTRLTGYEAAEAIGQSPKLLNAGVHDAAFFAELWQTILRGKSWHGEVTNRKKDGTLYTEEQTITPVLNEVGEATHFIAIKLDISQRKQAEARLRHSTKRLETMRAIDQTILNGRSTGKMAEIALHHLRQFICWTWASVSLLDMETSQATILALGEDGVVSTENNGRFRFDNEAVMEKIRQGQTYYLPDLQVVTPPSDFFAYLKASQVRTNLIVPLLAGEAGVIGLLNLAHEAPDAFDPDQIAIVREIADSLAIAVRHSLLYEAERVQRERAQALQETGLALNSTLDFDQLLAIVVDQALRVLPCDTAEVILVEGDQARMSHTRGFEKFGYEVAREIDGLTFALGDTANLDYILQTQQPLVIPDVLDYPGWLQDRSARHIRAWIGAPIFVHGEVTAVFALSKQDPGYYRESHLNLLRSFAAQASLALENAQLYKQLRHHAAELEDRVAKRTRALAEANKRLTELDQLKTKFIADISHELRTPITNINIYLDLTEKGRQDKREYYWQIVRHETARLTRLIESIFHESQQTNHLQQVTYAPVDLNRVVEEVVVAHEAMAQANNLQLSYSLQADLPPLVGERYQLARVVTNLLNNALRYTPAGSVHVRTFSQNGETYLQVEDTGIGIDAEDMPHLFDRFYRGRAAGQSTIPGVGLGLGVVAEIVKLHQGAVQVSNRSEGGALFEVRLPNRRMVV
jgi:PAS domain S-box-containing protein